MSIEELIERLEEIKGELDIKVNYDHPDIATAYESIVDLQKDLKK